MDIKQAPNKHEHWQWEDPDAHKRGGRQTYDRVDGCQMGKTTNFTFCLKKFEEE